MNSKQRVKIAMQNGTPDRVPVIPQICHPHALRALGWDYREGILACLKDPMLMNRLHRDCAKLYGVDGVRFWIPTEGVEVVDDGDNAWQLDKTTGEKIGRVDFQGGGGIIPLKEEPILNTNEDIENVNVPCAEELLKTPEFVSLQGLVAETGDDLFIIGGAGSPAFEHVSFMRGKQQALMDIMERPDFVKRMIDKSVDVCIQNSIALAKIGVDALYVGETFGGLIGPRLFKEFCLPAFSRLVLALAEYDVLIYLHICGNSTPLFELMADTGVDCIEPLDTLGGVSVADAKQRVGQRVALMGGVSTTLLAHGTLEEVVEDCQRCLREGAPGGGYILAAADMLPTETSREKVEAMIAAARNWNYSTSPIKT